MVENQQEFFNWHDIVVSKELTPLEDEFLEHIEKLEECNAVSAPLGFNLANIEYIDKDNVFFTTYSDKLEIWFKFEGKDFANISAATHPQLANSVAGGGLHLNNLLILKNSTTKRRLPRYLAEQ